MGEIGPIQEPGVHAPPGCVGDAVCPGEHEVVLSRQYGEGERLRGGDMPEDWIRIGIATGVFLTLWERPIA